MYGTCPKKEKTYVRDMSKKGENLCTVHVQKRRKLMYGICPKKEKTYVRDMSKKGENLHTQSRGLCKCGGSLLKGPCLQGW